MATSNNDRRNLARGGALSFVGSATSALLGFVLTIIISRFMGSDGAGIVFQAMGVFAVVMAFAKFGLDSTSIYLLPRVSIDDPRRLRGVIAACLAIALVISLVLTVIVEIAAPYLWPGGGDLLGAIRAIVWFVPFGAAMTIVAAMLRALGSVKEFVLVSNIGVPALRPPLMIIAAVATGSVVVVSAAWAVPMAIMLLVGLVLLYRRIVAAEGSGASAGSSAGSFGWRAPGSQYREIFRFATPRTISAGLEQAIIWADVLMIGWLMTDAAAGIYGGAARFIQAGLLVDAALRVVVSPRFSALLHQKRDAEVSALYRTATIWLVLLASPAYVLLGFFAPVFLALLGEEFVSGATTLAILATGMTVTFLAGNIHSLLIMSGRSGWAAINKAVVLTVNVVGNLIFVPQYGIEAAAVVWAFSMILDAVMAFIEVKVFLRLKLAWADSLWPLGIVLVSFALPAALFIWVLGQNVWALVATIIVGLGIFFVICRKFATQLELSGLVELVKKKAG